MAENTTNPIPVVLFAYARPEHLRRTLNCLRANRVPLIHAFSDAPKTPERAPAVEKVRAVLRAVDWCEMRLVERERNLGLGLSIRTGVTEVFETHEAVIVFEDDLVCVPGTYAWLCAALEHYRGDLRVMSVTGWTHPRVTPPDVGDRPYFDGRAECWTWGAWRRSWEGMERGALDMVRECEAKGIDPCRLGADLVGMAKAEGARNIWAVRWSFNHIRQGKLCLRPPWSMVEHIGFDVEATNAANAEWMHNPPLRACPPPPAAWPEAVESPTCAPLWREVCGGHPANTAPRPESRRSPGKRMKEVLRAATPPAVWTLARRLLRPPPSPTPAPPAELPEWEYIPEGWLYQSSGTSGWNVESVAKTQAERWPQFLKTMQGAGPLGVSHESPTPTAQDGAQHNILMCFGYVLALAAHRKDRLSVLDWGGGVGHYYVVARTLMPQLALDYHCKDLPLLCERGRKLLAEVQFHEDDRCLDRTYDLVFASGSLQYTEDWRGLSARLVKASEPYLYIARTPMVRTAPSFVALQRAHRYGYGTEYLTWFLNRDELEAHVTAQGADLVREFLLPSQFIIPNAPAVGELGGFLFRRREGRE